MQTQQSSYEVYPDSDIDASSVISVSLPVMMRGVPA